MQSEMERCDLRVSLREADALILGKDEELAAKDAVIKQLTDAANQAWQVAGHARKGEEDVKGAMLAQDHQLKQTQISLGKLTVRV